MFCTSSIIVCLYFCLIRNDLEAVKRGFRTNRWFFRLDKLTQIGRINVLSHGNPLKKKKKKKKNIAKP